MSTPARRPIPPRLWLYVGTIAAGALLLLALTYHAGPDLGGGQSMLQAVTLAVVIAWANRRPVHTAPRRSLNVSTAPEVAAVLLLPPAASALTLLGGTLAGETSLRVHPVQRLFNSSAAVWRGMVGSVTYELISGGSDGVALSPVAAILAAAAMYLAAFVLVRGVAFAQAGRAVLRHGVLPPREAGLAEAALSLTGILTAQAAAVAAWTLPMLVAPAAIAHRAVRDGLALREQKRVAEHALEETRAALIAREQFLTAAGHELRTPLTSLTTYLSHARRRLNRGAPAGEVDRLLAQSEQQAARMAGLVSALLDSAESGAVLGQLDRRALNPVELAHRCIALRRSLDPDRKITFEVNGEPPLITADAPRLEQALLALLDNAQRYSAQAQPVTVSLRADGDWLVIAVRDRGIGVPTAERDRIFERLYRASNVSENVSGLGLGLPAAAGIIAAHGGTLTLDCPSEGGSVFTIRLPTVGSHASLMDSPAPAQVG